MENNTDNQIKEAKSKILAGYIIAYRLFKLDKELAEKCMVELMIRKESGDNFEFEKYIEENVNETNSKFKPKTSVDLTKLSEIIKLAKK